MEPKDRTRTHVKDMGSIESWLVSAGRARKAGAPLNIPPWPASNFVLGGDRAYARDDGTPGWEAWQDSRTRGSGEGDGTYVESSWRTRQPGFRRAPIQTLSGWSHPPTRSWS